MTAKNAKMIGVWGGRGSGKSTKAKEKIRSIKRVVVFDPMDEYSLEGFQRFTTLRELGEAIAAGYWNGRMRVCYVPAAGKEPEALHQLSMMLMAIQQPYKDNQHTEEITLLVEEMNVPFPVTSLPANLNGFPLVCSRSRHYGISVIGVSQRMAEVNTRFRGNVSEQYFYRLTTTNDVAAACQLLGNEYRDKIKGNAPHNFLHWVEGGAVTAGKNPPP